jgi:Transposase
LLFVPYSDDFLDRILRTTPECAFLFCSIGDPARSDAARSLGVVEQTLANWVKAHRAGKLRGSGRHAELTAEQMEIRRLRAELARVRWYNRSRMHSTLDYSSPVDYEQRWSEKQTQAAA